MLGRKLRLDEAVLAEINNYFAARQRPMPANNEVQAMVPEGATVLAIPFLARPRAGLPVCPNPFRSGGPPAWLILLPGPPRELRPMLDDLVTR